VLRLKIICTFNLKKRNKMGKTTGKKYENPMQKKFDA
jgi:nuclear GTP-binding protein